jgi:hypothetical protein
MMFSNAITRILETKFVTRSEPNISGQSRSIIYRLNHAKNLPAVSTVVCGFIFMGVFSFTLAAPGLFQQDSSSYIEFDPARTAGYPLFLFFVRLLDSGYRSLPFVQMGLLIISTAYLIEACHGIYPAAITWALAGIIILMNPFLWRYTGMILTESVYSSLCMLVLASLFMALTCRPQGTGWLLTTGLFLGVAISIRPVGYALLVPASIGAVFWKTRFVRAFTAVALPVFACVLSLCSWNWFQHGIFATQVSGGYEIIGKVAVIIPADLPGPNRNVASQIAASVEPVASRLPHSIAQARDYYWMTYLGFNKIRREGALPPIMAAVDSRAKTSGERIDPIQTRLRMNDLAWDIAKETILYRPMAYLENVVIHFVALWTFPTLSSEKENTRIQDMLCGPELKLLYCPAGSAEPVRVVVPAALAVSKDIFFLLLMFTSFALPLVAVFKGTKSTLLAGLTVTALCINANYAIVALLEVGLPRYSIPMWPLVCIMTAGSILLFFSGGLLQTITRPSGKA